VALLAGSVVTLGPAFSCTVTCCETDATFHLHIDRLKACFQTILTGCVCVRSGAGRAHQIGTGAQTGKRI